MSGRATSSGALYTLPEGVETRWATPENPRGRRGAGGRLHHGRKGFACWFLRPGEELVLAEESGTSGIVRRIWVTLGDRTPAMLRALRLEFRWDGASRPAASVPLGDFFGAALGTQRPFESALFSSPEGRSFTCFVPMPFRTAMRISVANDGTETQYMLFSEVDYTVGDAIGDDALYFHAHWRAENPTTLLRDYEFLPQVRGRGRYLGTHVGVVADAAAYGDSWWGEGECKIWLDGDAEHPTLCGTGTEDYLGTGWELGAYHHRTQGCHLADPKRMRYGFYRWHLDDPVYFHEEIRVAMQQIGSWRPHVKDLLAKGGRPIWHAGAAAGVPPVSVDFSDPRTEAYGLFERQDAWSSCACFYLDRPENGLPALDPVVKRIADLPAYDEEEVRGLKSVPVEIRTLERWIPGAVSMSPDQLEELRDACDRVLKVMRDQERALREAGR